MAERTPEDLPIPSEASRTLGVVARRELLRLLHDSFGVDFSNYEPSTMERRTQRRMALLRLDRAQDYLEQLRSNAGELNILYSDLLSAEEEGEAPVATPTQPEPGAGKLGAHARLRSTDEELETSQDELQSMNQELVALNEELRNRIVQVESLHGTEKRLRGQLEALDRAETAMGRSLASVAAPDLQQFFQVIVEEARTLIDAEYAALGIGGDQHRPFEPWVFAGVSPERASAIGRTPRAVGLLGAVVRTDKAIQIRDVRQHPAFSGFPSNHPSMTSFLGVPIRYRGTSQGNLYLANKRGAEEFTAEDETLIGMLADRAGIVMEIARLRQREAREHGRLEFLAKAGPVLAQSIDFEATLKAIVRVIVPALADFCVISLMQEGTIRRVAVYHPESSKQKILEQLAGSVTLDELPAVLREALLTGEIQIVPAREMSEKGFDALFPNATDREVFRKVGFASAIAAPLVYASKAVGILLGVADSARTYTPEDVGLAREVLHHIALALQSARLYASARDALRTRDAVLAMVTHDLRNFLNTIQLSADALARRTSDLGDARRHVDSIKRAAGRMQQLIENLRDATTIEVGQFTVNPIREDVPTLVGDTMKMLVPQAEARGLSLTSDVADDLPAALCDHDRITQVLTNLVGNAIKFTPEKGQVHVEAKRLGDALCFAVRDTGSGIPKPDLSHIFERYWTKKGRDQRGQEGTGLGLFIAKGIVDAHHGRIWAESELGVGTTFYFTIPAAPESGADELEREHAPEP